jgi:type IV pilus assembly protein PilB
MIRKRIGDALIDAGLISKDQLSQALSKQKELGMRLGKVLVELKMCTDEQVAQALAGQLGIPLIKLDQIQIPPEIIKLIPETIIRTHTLLPVAKKGKYLTVAMADPLDAFIVDEIRYQTNLEVEEAIASESSLTTTIRNLYGSEDISQTLKTLKAEDGITSGLPAGSSAFDLQAMEEAAIVNFVSQLIKQAVNDKASDIHIEPEEDGVRVRYRQEGVLNEVVRVPKVNQPEIISRVKIMANMDISEKRLPQDGRIKVKMTNRSVDLRVSTLPAIWGEKIVIRILDKSSLNLSLPDVGFEDELLRRFEMAIRQPNGIILLNGPTGSGKTSTLYAAINFIQSPKINISTVEDPVEYQLRGINQVQVKPDIGLTFGRTLRSLMRQDPNVILVGEIRDSETATIAVEAALTGHLVLSTLHTNDAPSTVGRLIDLQVEPYLIASTLLAAVAQRLVRRICPFCKQPHPLSLDDERNLQLDSLGYTESPGFFKGAGCPSCSNSGYSGRTAIHELMTLNDEIRRLILAKASSNELRRLAVDAGMTLLRLTGVQKAAKGITTIEEVLRVTKSEEL